MFKTSHYIKRLRLLIVLLYLSGCGQMAANQSFEFSSSTMCDRQKLEKFIGEDHVLVGDMVVPITDVLPEDLESFYPAKAQKLQESPKILQGVALRSSLQWPGGVMPLQFSSSFSQSTKNKILSACAKFSEFAKVRCKERDGERYYVDVISSRSGCFSTVGRTGRSYLNLSSSCLRDSIIIHELMHSLGIKHEHAHPDRDRHIRIIEENVISSKLSNFIRVRSPGETTGFDFKSIMLYRSYAFRSRSNYPTGVKRSPLCDQYDRTGFPSECLYSANSSMSDKDKELIMKMYGAAAGTTPVPMPDPQPVPMPDPQPRPTPTPQPMPDPQPMPQPSPDPEPVGEPDVYDPIVEEPTCHF